MCSNSSNEIIRKKRAHRSDRNQMRTAGGFEKNIVIEAEKNVIFVVINQSPQGVSRKHFMCMFHQSIACVQKHQDSLQI